MFQYFSLSVHSSIAGCFLSIQPAGFQREAEGDTATHEITLFASGMVGISNSFLDSFPLQLGKYDANVEHSAAHGGSGIKFFRTGYEYHVMALKQIHQPCKIKNGAAAPVKFIANHTPDFSVTYSAQHLLELRPVRVFSAVATVCKNLKRCISNFNETTFDLCFDRNTVRFVDGLPCVYRTPPMYHHSKSQAARILDVPFDFGYPLRTGILDGSHLSQKGSSYPRQHLPY